MLYDDKKFVGAKIQEYRKKRKLTQAQLAERVGLTDKHIGRIESGNFFPACNKFLNILEVLDININEFGFKVNKDLDKSREKLLKAIYNLPAAETKIILPILESVIKGINEAKKI